MGLTCYALRAKTTCTRFVLMPEARTACSEASISRTPRHRESSHSNEPYIDNLPSTHQQTTHQSTRQYQDFSATYLTPNTDVRPFRRTPPGHRCPPRLPHHPSPDGLALPLPRGPSQQHSLQPAHQVVRPQVLVFHGYVRAKKGEIPQDGE
jgi:hypothetical protein